VIVPTLTAVQKALAFHPESDLKADEKTNKFLDKSEEKSQDGKTDQATKALGKALETCGGVIVFNPDGTPHCVE
jgi:hypothetical protein